MPFGFLRERASCVPSRRRHAGWRVLLRGAAVGLVFLRAPDGLARPLAGLAAGRVLVSGPAHPRATLVMLPGGAGDVGIRPDGTVRHGANFVVRTRALWAARGYAVVLADAPDDMTLRGVRSTPAYADRVAALVRLARERFGAPVFLLGTSQGSIAAMNGAAHAPPGTLAGVILSEPVSVLGGSHETVFDADPEGVRVPVLIVVNRDDRCPVAPPGAAAAIRAALSASPDVSVLSVSGGRDEDGTPCGSLSPHGYAGIETPVVDGIGRWVLSRLAARQ